MKIQITNREELEIQHTKQGGFPSIVVETRFEPDITIDAATVDEAGLKGVTLARGFIKREDGSDALAFFSVRLKGGRPEFELVVKVNGEKDQIYRSAIAGWRPKTDE